MTPRRLVNGGIIGLGLSALMWSTGLAQGPAPLARTSAPQPPARKYDLQKFTAVQRLVYVSALRGAEWLKRVQRADGRFQYGYLPALARPVEGDDYLGQVGATLALARAARFFGDERGTAQAQQALLTLMHDTGVDSKSPEVRVPSAPLTNRLAAAGLLVAAIHELPTPGKDLLEQADQLCEFIRRQQQEDGSLKWSDGPVPAGAAAHEAANLFPALALYGVIRSQHLRPAPWKLEMVRKARTHYAAKWREHRAPLALPWHSATCAEAALLTKERPFVDTVHEMNDWLCTLQYQQVDPRRTHWQGGFMSWQDGRAVPAAPTIQSAFWAMSLAEACRTARLASDDTRLRSYTQALHSALTFVTTLQYSEVNTGHFAERYRSELMGGFHASHQDGNLRIDYAQYALAAEVHYLQHLAALP